MKKPSKAMIAVSLLCVLLVALGVAAKFINGPEGTYSVLIEVAGTDDWQDEYQVRLREDIGLSLKHFDHYASTSENARSRLRFEISSPNQFGLVTAKVSGKCEGKDFTAELSSLKPPDSDSEFDNFLTITRQELVIPAFGLADAKARGKKGFVYIGSSHPNGVDEKLFDEIRARIQELGFSASLHQFCASRDTYGAPEVAYRIEYSTWHTQEGKRVCSLYGYLPNSRISSIFELTGDMEQLRNQLKVSIGSQ